MRDLRYSPRSYAISAEIIREIRPCRLVSIFGTRRVIRRRWARSAISATYFGTRRVIRRRWAHRDERHNFAQKHDVELVKQMVRPDVELRVRAEVRGEMPARSEALGRPTEHDLITV